MTLLAAGPETVTAACGCRIRVTTHAWSRHRDLAVVRACEQHTRPVPPAPEPAPAMVVDEGPLRHLFMRHREQRMGGVTIGCSCSWCPARSLGPLGPQYAAHVAAEVAHLIGGDS